MNERTPSNLGAGKTLWKRVVGVYDLRPDELRLLEDACREVDLTNALERVIRESPPMVTGSTGQLVVHPAIQEVRLHRTVLKQILGHLKLPDDVGAAPPASSEKARAVANARWQRSG